MTLIIFVSTCLHIITLLHLLDTIVDYVTIDLSKDDFIGISMFTCGCGRSFLAIKLEKKTIILSFGKNSMIKHNYLDLAFNSLCEKVDKKTDDYLAYKHPKFSQKRWRLFFTLTQLIFHRFIIPISKIILQCKLSNFCTNNEDVSFIKRLCKKKYFHNVSQLAVSACLQK